MQTINLNTLSAAPCRQPPTSLHLTTHTLPASSPPLSSSLRLHQVMEYAAANYDPAFVLKTDDDAFINVAPLMEELRAMCENPDCRRERLYMGKMAKHSEVLLQPGHKWNNAAFHNHTGAGSSSSRRARRGAGSALCVVMFL